MQLSNERFVTQPKFKLSELIKSKRRTCSANKAIPQKDNPDLIKFVMELEHLLPNYHIVLKKSFKYSLVQLNSVTIVLSANNKIYYSTPDNVHNEISFNKLTFHGFCESFFTIDELIQYIHGRLELFKPLKQNDNFLFLPVYLKKGLRKIGIITRSQLLAEHEMDLLDKLISSDWKFNKKRVLLLLGAEREGVPIEMMDVLLKQRLSRYFQQYNLDQLIRQKR